jgi:hypothetical protein
MWISSLQRPTRTHQVITIIIAIVTTVIIINIIIIVIHWGWWSRVAAKTLCSSGTIQLFVHVDMFAFSESTIPG